MPDFEFEFNQQDKDLIVNQSVGEFSNKDYMRLTIYPTEAINNIVDLPDDTKGVDGKAIYYSSSSVQSGSTFSGNTIGGRNGGSTTGSIT